MITLVLIFLILIAALLGAYTMNFQETTLALGKKLASDNLLLPTGFQDAITPKAQTTRNIIYPVLILIVLVYGFIFYRWYIAIGCGVLTFFIAIPVLKRVLPEPGSHFYKNRIKNDLLKRQAQFKKIGDTQREIAVNEVLKRLEATE